MIDDIVENENNEILEHSTDNRITEVEITQERHHSSVGDNIAEAVLSFIAYTILIVGVVVSIITGCLLVTDDYEWDNKIGKFILIGGPIASIVIWASCMIPVNISNNIRQIKYELRRR